MFSDFPPALVYPDSEQGRARQKADAIEEELLIGKTALCSEWEPTAHPIFVDDDAYRDSKMAPCARRKRDGVRDMNWCCRCMAGLPGTFQEKGYETYRDSRISV